jgi:hypothetical protein
MLHYNVLSLALVKPVLYKIRALAQMSVPGKPYGFILDVSGVAGRGARYCRVGVTGAACTGLCVRPATFLAATPSSSPGVPGARHSFGHSSVLHVTASIMSSLNQARSGRNYAKKLRALGRRYPLTAIPLGGLAAAAACLAQLQDAPPPFGAPPPYEPVAEQGRHTYTHLSFIVSGYFMVLGACYIIITIF